MSSFIRLWQLGLITMACTSQSTNPVHIHKNFDEEKEAQAKT